MGRHNFTYFYILRFLHLSDLKLAISGRILDVGCGVGGLALYLCRYAKQVVGIDVSTRAIKIARQAAKHNQVSNVYFAVQKMTVQKNNYDLIMATEVIEHIQNDQKFLQNIYASLKKSGYLLLSTPSVNSLMYHWGWYEEFDHQVGHLRRYTAQDLSQLLRQIGFKVVTLSERESLLRSILFTTKLGFLIRFIRGPLVYLFHFVDEIFGYVFGFTDIIILAKK